MNDVLVSIQDVVDFKRVAQLVLEKINMRDADPAWVRSVVLLALRTLDHRDDWSCTHCVGTFKRAERGARYEAPCLFCGHDGRDPREADHVDWFVSLVRRRSGRG